MAILKTGALKPTLSSIAKEDDILVTRVGSIGVCGIVEKELAESFFSDNLIRIRLTTDSKVEISPNYLNLLLNTTYGQMQMLRYSRGSVQQRLNQSQLAQIPIPIIQWQRQQEIEHFLMQHRAAKRESESLLCRAKTRVEQLIEAAVQP
jgi:type I restriction enzyme S subunit